MNMGATRDQLTQVLLQLDGQRSILDNPLLSVQARATVEKRIASLVNQYVHLRSTPSCPTWGRGNIGQVSIEEETRIAVNYFLQMVDGSGCWENIPLSDSIRELAGNAAVALESLPTCEELPPPMPVQRPVSPTIRRLRTFTPMVVSVIPAPMPPSAPSPVAPGTASSDFVSPAQIAVPPAPTVFPLSGLG